MPPPSEARQLPAHHPATRRPPQSPDGILAEAEAQWLYTEAELANSPSIQDGMPQAEEQAVRAKGVNFIVQVGILLKLPQLTLSTASIYFQRYLMRASLKSERNGFPKLHHYQAAGVALFVATKVEESCRRLRDLILALCRVAQKNPNLIIDDQSKDWWRWRDCLLFNEDVMMEAICFDYTIESPHRQLFGMLKFNGVEHNKRLRNAAWGFVTDSNNTQLCLLFNSRTIAVASLYAACRYCDVQLPDDNRGRPWWEAQHVSLHDVRKAMDHMLANYDHAADKINGIATSSGVDGNGSIYAGLATPTNEGGLDGWDSTRVKGDGQGSTASIRPPGSERRSSNASSIGIKRGREGSPVTANGETNSHNGTANEQALSKRQRVDEAAIIRNQSTITREERRKPQSADTETTSALAKSAKTDEGEVSEEGEVEE
jgi:hypothetical protein